MKKIKILLLFILILFLCPCFSFGFTDIGINGTEVSFPDIQSDVDVSNGFVVSLYEGTYYMCVLPTPDSYWHCNTNSPTHLGCSNVPFKEYKSTGGDWTYNRSYEYSACPGLGHIIYSSNDIYNDIEKSGYYYQVPEKEEEYIFPYIADTDDELLEIKDGGYLLIMPRFCSKYKTYSIFYIKSIGRSVSNTNL